MNIDTAKIEKPLGIALVSFGAIEASFLTFLTRELAGVSSRSVRVLSPLAIPKEAYEARRRQYHATIFLKRLLPMKETGWERVLGVADVDLYVPGLNFVFGEADPTAGVAVFSLFRLRLGAERPSAETVVHRRMLTEAVHELGHTYGLGHCSNPTCVMFFSNSLADTDRKGFAFCRRCRDAFLHGSG